MNLSDKGLMALISHEGIVQSRYKDSVGVWTIGVGHTVAAGGINPANFAGTLTIKEVFDLLREDVAKYAAAVNRAVKVPLEQHQFDALVSFHYNTGAIGKATLVKKLNAGDIAGAAKGFDAWVKPAEIKPRRIAEKALFQTGNYPAPFATVYPATPQGKVLWAQGRRVDLAKALFIETAKPVAPIVSHETPSVILKPDSVSPTIHKPVETRPEVILPPVNPPAVKQSFIARLIALILSLFGRKS